MRQADVNPPPAARGIPGVIQFGGQKGIQRPMNTTYSFGSWVAQRRKTLDLTQRELAAGASCAPATIKKIEVDQRRPSRLLASALADALCIPEGSRALFTDCARGLRAVDALGDPADGRAQTEDQLEKYGSTALSVPPTPLIGREAELRQIALYLDDYHCRLITLVGPGGIGKTRLAYQAAINYAPRLASSGVCMVSLAGINTKDYLVATIAEALRLQTVANDDPTSQLLNFLRPRQLLLLLDNFEHLMDGVDLLTDILIAAPNVKILVTSRERLNLSPEWLIVVNGLPLLEDGNSAAHALTLFEMGARRVQPNFRLDDARTAVMKICELVEGMPLAIELAASWVRRMSPDEIVRQIESDPDFLTASWRDVPERHRSIRALFDHSWRLLSPQAQTVLMKLAVFRDGFNLDAARQVAGASPTMLALLEDKSLVQGKPAGRYDLHELIRQHAESQLVNTGKYAEIRDLHLDYFVSFAETGEKALHGPHQVTWARRFSTEHNNLRTALEWAFDNTQLAELGLRITNALWFYWFRWSGKWTEGLQWMERGLKCSQGVTATRAYALQSASQLAAQIGSMRLARESMQLGLQYSQQLGLPYNHAAAVMGMTVHLHDYAQVVAKFEETIAALRQSAPPYMVATTLFLFGDRARTQGDLERAEALYHEGLTIAQAEQDLMLAGAMLERLGRLAAIKGDYTNARAFYQENSTLVQQLDYPLGVSEYAVSLGVLAIYHGDYDFAEECLRASLKDAERLNNHGGKMHALYLLAELALHRRKYEEATRLLLASLQLTIDVPDWQSVFGNREFNCERMIIAGKLAHALGEYHEAVLLISSGERIRADSGYILDAHARAEYEDVISQCHRQLGESEFAKLWQSGQLLSEESALLQAVAHLQERVSRASAASDSSTSQSG